MKLFSPVIFSFEKYNEIKIFSNILWYLNYTSSSFKLILNQKENAVNKTYRKDEILGLAKIPCCCIFGNTFAYFQKEEGGIISAVGAYLAIIL